MPMHLTHDLHVRLKLHRKAFPLLAGALSLKSYRENSKPKTARVEGQLISFPALDETTSPQWAPWLLSIESQPRAALQQKYLLPWHPINRRKKLQFSILP